MPITISGSTGIAGVDGSASTPAVQGTDTNTGIAFPAADTVAIGTGGTERMRVDSSGNVGIGTTSPGARLGINGGAGTSQTRFEVSTTQVQEVATNAAANAYADRLTDAAQHIWKVTGSERARISANGELLVNTTTNETSSRISTRATTGVINGVGVYCTTAVNTGAVVFFNPNGQVGTINVNGTATGYNTSSDYRLKYDVQPLASGLATIKSLKPVIYKWNADNTDGAGFIAHELAEHIPAAVSGEKDAINKDGSINPQGVDYSKIVVHLVAAIQEQQTQIATLEARLTALEAK